jgi:hypothetical protein
LSEWALKSLDQQLSCWLLRDFYFWASGRSVTLPASRYDYSSDWTPLLVRLSLTGMAASLAAPEVFHLLRSAALLAAPGIFTPSNRRNSTHWLQDRRAVRIALSALPPWSCVARRRLNRRCNSNIGPSYRIRMIGGQLSFSIAYFEIVVS